MNDMNYVITCGDEGVQINEGTRLGLVGAGVKLDHASEVIQGFKKALGKDIAIAANEENDWIKTKFELDTWEQASATMQQQVEAVADAEGINYAGLLPFADPQELEHDIKGHMVRPKGMHIGNKIVFTLAGGEFKYHLGHFLISAEWITHVDEAVAKEVIQTQVEYYNKLGKAEKSFPLMFEVEGPLEAEQVRKNRMLLEKLGFKGQVIEHEE